MLINVPASHGVALNQMLNQFDQRVGAFLFTEIDQHIANNQPYSISETTIEKIDQLWAASRPEDPGTYTPTGGEQAFLQGAYLWYVWLHFWELSLFHQACPEECRDDKFHEKMLLSAKKQLCQCLKGVGITDPEICAAFITAPELEFFSITNKINHC